MFRRAGARKSAAALPNIPPDVMFSRRRARAQPPMPALAK
jgi:hypothetical protein